MLQTIVLRARTCTQLNEVAAMLKAGPGEGAEVTGERPRTWIGRHFAERSALVAQAALALAHAGRFVLEWHGGAGGARLNDDAVLAGNSAAECVAYLLERVTTEAVWPDRVEYSEVAARTEFWVANKLFAVVRPLQAGLSASTKTGGVRRLMVRGHASDARHADVARRTRKSSGHEHLEKLETSPLLAAGYIEPVRRVEASSRWKARVAKACGRDYLAGLQALFMVPRTGLQRLKFSAAETGRILVAVDGAWTILLDDEPSGQPTCIWLLLAGQDGVHRHTCSIPLDAIQLREFLGDVVVTQEAEGRVPVAILKGLTPGTVRKLCALCHGSFALPELEPDELRSNAAFYSLYQSCTAAGALAPAQRQAKKTPH